MPRPAAGTSRRAVYEGLRHRVLTLELPPGALLSENELAAELGLSRTPVRESLILLTQEGLVQVVPKVGTFVSRVDPELVADAQFLREAVELASLDDVPVDLDPVQVAALRENLARQDEVDGDPDDFFALDEEFHLGLLRLAGHERTWPTVSAAKGHLDRARRLGMAESSSMRDLRDQHAAVLDALVQGDVPTARDLLRSHLRAVFDDIERVRRRRPELFSTGSGTAPTRRSVAVWD